jgi:hypothetical protein
MKIYFTTNEKFWSKVFKFLVQEKVTHVLFKFEVDGFEFCIDCSTSGGRLMTWEKSKSFNFPVYGINLFKDAALEKQMFALCLRLTGVKYDFGAYAYGLYRALLRRFLGIKGPKINKWSHPDKYACTEIFEPIRHILWREFGISFANKDLSIMSPLEIYTHIERQLHVKTD